MSRRRGLDPGYGVSISQPWREGEVAHNLILVRQVRRYHHHYISIVIIITGSSRAIVIRLLIGWAIFIFCSSIRSDWFVLQSFALPFWYSDCCNWGVAIYCMKWYFLLKKFSKRCNLYQNELHSISLSSHLLHSSSSYETSHGYTTILKWALQYPWQIHDPGNH
jgi:hypothetical protein